MKKALRRNSIIVILLAAVLGMVFFVNFTGGKLMVKQRVPVEGFLFRDEKMAAEFDTLQRGFMDNGTIAKYVNNIINFGITKGSVLQIGCSHCFVGLEWLKRTKDTRLYWLENNTYLKEMAQKNALAWGLSDRVICEQKGTTDFPFEDETFDAVISKDNLNQWVKPEDTFKEIERVLKKGGRCYITDGKRNINPILFELLKIMMAKQSSMKEIAVSTINAAYLKDEIVLILKKSNLSGLNVTEDMKGLTITRVKI